MVAHSSGSSSSRLDSPIALGLWEGQHIMVGVHAKTDDLSHDPGSRARREEAGVPQSLSRVCS